MASAPMTLPSPAATPALSLRLVVDSASRRVLFAEAGGDAVAFLSALLATPVRTAIEMLLQEDPPSATAGCFGNFSAAGALQPPRGVASTSSSSMTAPPASPASASQARPPPGMGIISAMRLYRCDHLRCRCSDVVSRSAGSACPCVSCGAGGTRGTELHFLEAVFYRRADGSAVATARRGAGRSGVTFYRCHAHDKRHGGRDVYLCRGRVTDERGVVCPLCHNLTTVTVRLAKGGDEEGSSASTAPGLRYAIMDDLAVRNMTEGLSRGALLAELGVADPAAVREEVVPFGYKQVLSMLWASLQTKTVLTDVFLRTADARRRR